MRYNILWACIVVCFLLTGVEAGWAAKASHALKVHYEATGGFAYRHVVADVETQGLSVKEAKALGALVRRAGFWCLPAEILDPNPCCDRTEYTITAVEGNRTHTVKTIDGKVPEALQPLLQWLRGRAHDVTER